MPDKKSSEGKFSDKVDARTSPAEAAAMALRQEQKARAFYEECARIMKHPGARKMFEFLAQEEKKHEALIQKELDTFNFREM